jgi:hypothetical protein
LLGCLFRRRLGQVYFPAVFAPLPAGLRFGAGLNGVRRAKVVALRSRVGSGSVFGSVFALFQICGVVTGWWWLFRSCLVVLGVDGRV